MAHMAAATGSAPRAVGARRGLHRPAPGRRALGAAGLGTRAIGAPGEPAKPHDEPDGDMPAMTGASLLLALGPASLGTLLRTADRLVTGGNGCLMFGASTCVQFAVRALPTRRILATAVLLTGAGMLGVVAAICTQPLLLWPPRRSSPERHRGFRRVLPSQLLCRQDRLAEANAALSAGGYAITGELPIATGYLGDATSMTTSTTVFATVTAAAALTGALMIRQIRA